MKIHFPAEHVKALIEVTQTIEGPRTPSQVQMLDANYWRDDLPQERREALELYVLETKWGGEAPTEADIDPDKIPPCIWLVGDHGIYLQSNADFDQVKQAMADRGLHHVCYADECNAQTMDVKSLYATKREVFGVRDDKYNLTLETLEYALGEEALTIELTPNAMCIRPSPQNLPEPSPEPSEEEEPSFF